jgi:hypothetical protein
MPEASNKHPERIGSSQGAAGYPTADGGASDYFE